ncbi:hypothetical protein GALMADRAFT_800977 [Galerina marginata CBS 339.88]|uniref:Uncharacterized protein n=1 Tax=Galerina marginata (strain CBS 339.88) TaxID=685588 RepID=A0A067SN03_GALM3|nr:hypothetical protein GALMADRAFT_800977 [Galerina marginata CBS 339.88]
MNNVLLGLWGGTRDESPGLRALLPLLVTPSNVRGTSVVSYVLCRRYRAGFTVSVSSSICDRNKQSLAIDIAVKYAHIMSHSHSFRSWQDCVQSAVDGFAALNLMVLELRRVVGL